MCITLREQTVPAGIIIGFEYEYSAYSIDGLWNISTKAREGECWAIH